MKHIKNFKLFESEFTDDDTVVFTEDVECEVFTKPNQQKGKMETISKGEEADVFSIPDKGDHIGVQFGDGSTTWVDKKFLKKK